MAAENFVLVESKKYGWDGQTYASADEAAAKKAEYEGKGFEVYQTSDADGHYVYSRRVVTEIVLEGDAPA